ncbi:hypothetical protein TRICI_002977 [Trichomonascus ciferrii]|uniref:Uncharacterized protein n=1 Tax=Trichomonascus ciferrii TaxID=44093 RepID=A0A642VAA6_9ASCO|nr:hypothetical protein TRICI_002977 [Trichomonascus ciferrii]
MRFNQNLNQTNDQTIINDRKNTLKLHNSGIQNPHQGRITHPSDRSNSTMTTFKQNTTCRDSVVRVQDLQRPREFEYNMDNNKYSNFIIFQGIRDTSMLTVSIRESTLSTAFRTLLASSPTTTTITTVESTPITSIKSNILVFDDNNDLQFHQQIQRQIHKHQIAEHTDSRITDIQPSPFQSKIPVR